MSPASGASYLEEFEVGQRRRSRPWSLTGDDMAACAAVIPGAATDDAAQSIELQQLLGLRLRAELLGELDWPFGDLRGPGTTRWTVHQGLAVADSVRLETAVTRCRRAPDQAAGTLHVHTRLVDEHGAARHEGTSTALLPVRPGSDPPPPHRDFGSPAWGAVLAERVASERAFAAATATFDGSIELQAGDDRVQLRVYRGEVLAASRTTPSGPTFTVAAEEVAWLELAEASRNDYIQHAMQGRFRARGNTHEYLRLTKAMVTLWDAIRDLAGLSGAAR